MDDRSVQRLMTAAGYYKGGIDGDFGPKSWTAARLLLERNEPDALAWSTARQKVAVGQIILKASGHYAGDIDGWAGDLTREALNAWDFTTLTGEVEVLPGREATPGGDMPTPTGQQWPSQAGVRAFYGQPGAALCTAGSVILPFPFRVAWNRLQKVSKYNCHPKVAEAMTAIWADAAEHYGQEEFTRLGLDLYGGCYNNRLMRGGTAVSMHAYGIAYDCDPERNQLRWGSDRAELAKEPYNAFWRIVEAQGAISLGKERNYDWMHFQFATL